MRKLRFSASAENDLLKAWLYIAEDSMSAADRMLDQVDTAARTLLEQPEMGRTRTG